MNIITTKLKEVSGSVLPILGLVLGLHFLVIPLPSVMLWRFLIGTFLVIFGLTLFLLGVELGITPLGSLTGKALSKSKSVIILLISGLILGFFISIAEPGLLVLANQVNIVSSGAISSQSILIIVSIGMAIMISVGFLRIFFNIPLFKLLLVLYGLVFVFSLFTSREFLAIAFDASGATTGILAVPFILTLSFGISKLKKDSKASEKDSFGLVAIASIGAILSVLIFDVFTPDLSFNATLTSSLETSTSIILPFFNVIPPAIFESLMAIFPLAVIFIILQNLFFKLKRLAVRKIVTGFAYVLIGLLLFLVGVNAGFMDVGTYLGQTLVLKQPIIIIVVGFILGALTILAEPAVYVLTHQIEEVTSGYIPRLAVLLPLSLGVGLAIALSIIRILVPSIQLWHYLLPGYIISLSLMFFVPKLFIGIAFDAGGVATGPVTATFILAFIQGAAFTYEGADLLIDGFGMIAMVAMIPIITLQILGLIFKKVTQKKGGVKPHESNQHNL
ncbi:MAG: DUF1538 domain-containing protein [Erysipelotrichaceae bacterium]|nr:DUF1538 domain-containing protein [Erysipelotrichaceae bacterium]